MYNSPQYVGLPISDLTPSILEIIILDDDYGRGNIMFAPKTDLTYSASPKHGAPLYKT